MKLPPKISIVIPVKNGMDTLPQLVEGIQKQTLFKDCEVIAIDSGSTDGSAAFLSKFAFITVIPIDPKTFNHGATRNLGVSHARGEFVVMTVQDAQPANEFWLESMLAHFKDSEVSAVCGQQIVPHDADKNPHEWFRPQSEPVPKYVQFKNSSDFMNLSPKEQRSFCGWDDVNAMYRKTVLLKIPFETTAYGEDMLWAKAALEQGHKIVYDYTSQVYHYHFQFPEYTYKRVLISKVFTYLAFGYARPHNYSLKDYGMVVLRNIKWQLHPKWILHNWNIINNNRKATSDFLVAVENNTIPTLEKELALNIPVGTQNQMK